MDITKALKNIHTFEPASSLVGMYSKKTFWILKKIYVHFCSL